jgi:hypothetical protein
MKTVGSFGGSLRTTPVRSALRVQECCVACRRPAAQCAGSDCRSGKTYPGVLLRGEWLEAEASVTPYVCSGTAMHHARNSAGDVSARLSP